MLLLNKPAGIVMHPTYKHVDGDTLWDALLSYLAQQEVEVWTPPELADEPEWSQAPEHVRVLLRQVRYERLMREEGPLPRPCLLHRLDKDTSGIVALARTERARRFLSRQFHEHTIMKRYLAVVAAGSPDWARPRTSFTLTQTSASGQTLSWVLPDAAFDLSRVEPMEELLLCGALQRDPDDRRRCIVGSDGQEAATVVRVLAHVGGYTLLEARPVTGRTHQIRAHLAALGYPIVGDQTYSLPDSKEAVFLERQFLHAYSLTLRRYPDNTLCTFTAPLADDLVAWLERAMPEATGVFHAYTTQFTESIVSC